MDLFLSDGRRPVLPQDMLVGRLDDSERSIRRALQVRPDIPTGNLLLGLLALMRGKSEEARAARARFSGLIRGGEYLRLVTEALVEHTAGNAAAATSAVEGFEKRFGRDDPYLCARVRARRGEADRAFARLDKAFTAREAIVTTRRLRRYGTGSDRSPGMSG